MYYFKGVINSLIVDGYVEFENIDDAKSFIKLFDIKLVKIFQLNLIESKLHFTKKFNNKKLSYIFTNLYELIKIGLTPYEAIQLLSNSFRGKERVAMVKVCSYVEAGMDFSSAFLASGCFPSFAISLLKVGEDTSNIVEALASLVEYYSNSQKISDKIATSLSYPVVLLLFLFIVINFANKYLFPAYFSLLKDFNVQNDLILDLIQMFVEFSNIYGKFLLICIFLLVIATIILYKRIADKRKGIEILYRIPLFGKRIKQYYSMLFLQLFYISIKSGYLTHDAFRIALQAMPNPYIRKISLDMVEGVRSGNQLWQTLRNYNFIEDDVVAFIHQGEESGNMLSTAELAAKYTYKRFIFWLDIIVKMASPIILLIVGVVILLFVLMLVKPMLNLLQSI